VRLPATAVMVGAVAFAAAACGGSSSGGDGDANGAGDTGGTGAPGGTAAQAQHPSALVGEVGKNDAFAISLQDEKGKAITNLAAGTYKLTVHDDSGIHNFHLNGAGVSDLTSVPEKGTKQFTVTFKAGTYTFVCDPHASQMRGEFTVS
jgi:plastocyanin